MDLKKILLLLFLNFIGFSFLFAPAPPPWPPVDASIPLQGSELMLILAGGFFAIYTLYRHRAKSNVAKKN